MPNLTNITARHAHFIEQFKNGEIKKFTPFLNRVAKGMREELLKSDNVYSKAVMRRKLAFIDSLVSGEFKTYTDQLSGDLGLFADEEAEFTAASLNKVQALVEATIPASSQLKAAINARPFNNRLLKDYLNDFSKDQAKAVKNAVSMGFFEGKSTKDIINDVVGSKSLGYKNGILNVSRTSAERMVRTSIAHTASVAKSYTLEENIDITPYYEWSSILDGRTSPICQAGDNTIYPVGKGPLAPHHYNCRSVEVALFDDDVEIVNGKPVKIDTSGNEQSYNTWLGKQSNKFQDEVLGATKAELYRKGGLTVDKFVNNAGQTLTLAQLRSKYASAWGKTFDTVTPIKAAVVKVAPKPIVTKVTPKPKQVKQYSQKEAVSILNERFENANIRLSKDKGSVLSANEFISLTDDYNLGDYFKGASFGGKTGTGKAWRRGNLGVVESYRNSGDTYYGVRGFKPTENAATTATMRSNAGFSANTDPINWNRSTAVHEFAHLLYSPNFITMKGTAFEKDFKSFLKGDTYKGYLAANRRYNIENNAFKEYGMRKLSKKEITNAEYNEFAKDFRINFRNRADNKDYFVSVYSMTNDAELLAEAFAEYKLSSNPRKIALELGAMYDKHFLKGKP